MNGQKYLWLVISLLLYPNAPGYQCEHLQEQTLSNKSVNYLVDGQSKVRGMLYLRIDTGAAAAH